MFDAIPTTRSEIGNANQELEKDLNSKYNTFDILKPSPSVEVDLQEVKSEGDTNYQVEDDQDYEFMTWTTE